MVKKYSFLSPTGAAAEAFIGDRQKDLSASKIRG
jgi:hypothetical protein